MLAVATAAAQDQSVDATVSTTMQSSHFSVDARPELAMDRNQKTYFLSDRSAHTGDDFRVVLSSPSHVTQIAVTTGDKDGADQLQAGSVEISEDGREYREVGTFSNGQAKVFVDAPSIVAVRIKPTASQDQPLAIREITLSGVRINRVTRDPRIDFDYSLAPDLGSWAQQAVEIAEKSYPMIARELNSPGYLPPNHVHIWFNTDYNGVAATGGEVIEISPTYVRAHKDDFGMVVHELTHAVQHYTHGDNPGWLVEGIADWIRFYKYEPQVPRPRINPARAKYSDAYRTTAAFLAYAEEKYDRRLVWQLNEAMREATYSPDIWRKYTGKEPGDIWTEFIADLQAGKTKLARLAN